MEYILLILISVIGGFVQSASGMGHGIVLMSTATLFFPYISLMISVKFIAFVFFVPVIFMLNKIKWKLLAVPILFSIVGILLGTQVLLVSSESELTFLLGVIMAVLGFFNLLYKPKRVYEPKWWLGAVAGVASGFFSAVASLAGPPLVLYFINKKELAEDTDAYYATIMTGFLLLNAQQMFTLGLTGILSFEAVYIFLICVIPIFVGIWLGRKWAKKVKPEKIKRAVYLLMSIMGVYLIATNFNAVI